MQTVELYMLDLNHKSILFYLIYRIFTLRPSYLALQLAILIKMTYCLRKKIRIFLTIKAHLGS